MANRLHIIFSRQTQDDAPAHTGGFTIVELLVVVSVFAIIGVAYSYLVANYFVVINRNGELADMTMTSQNLLRSTVENIRLGDGVRQSNQITDPNAPGGGWNTSDTSFVIVLAVPALDSSHDYIIDPDTGSPYMNELIYYKNGSQLMERRLANPDAAGDTLKTTCPSNLATPTCQADIELADYVNSMTFTFYDQDADQTSNPTEARSVKISLNMQRNAPGEPLNLATTMQVTLRNRF
ncbi:MAG TPA: prepilin-type N-terminal cleavage/methylation domain-containing protein [Candidatus Saccharimonadales bacterium]|nr:prepilin-type N-terminal cleavage/methylation domain-containing protein [Candidatus Saccharimonadales bacterium]